MSQLLNHMVGALTMFREVGTAGSLDPQILDQDLVGPDAAAALTKAGTEAIAAWSQPGRVDGTANLPFGEFPAQFALQLPAMDMLVTAGTWPGPRGSTSPGTRTWSRTRRRWSPRCSRTPPIGGLTSARR